MTLPTTQNQVAKQRSPALMIFLLLPLLGMLFAILMIASNPTQAPSNAAAQNRALATPVIMNNPASDFTLTDLSGSRVSLADYAGRVVFINFWWTGCPPCIKELPEFQAFAAQQGDDGAVVLAVNTAETQEQIDGFLAQNNINLNDVPVLLDTDYTVMREYGVALFPTTYVISAEGIISGVKFGAMTVEEMNSYLADAA